ncbi:MAG: malate dehydrogenase [Chlorobi bacterium]|nr:malate dehydrogenase [Chlorobiota bacterium]
MKITVIGAGHVGEVTTQRIVDQELAQEVVLVDIIEGIPQGKGLDIFESTPIGGTDVKVVGTNDYEPTADSDIIVMTAGMPRKPGMSRDDLLQANTNIVQSCVEKAAPLSPNAIIIMVANPLDVMTYVAYKLSGFPKHRVFGMAGILDTARYRAFIAEALDVSVRDISAIVMGGHGDSMVPLPRYTTIAGVPLAQFMSQDKIDAIVERTRKGGGEIVAHLKTGSAYYAPSAAAVEMVDAIVNNKRRILPCSAWLEGEYGLNDVYVGVPVKLGRNGIIEVVEVQLTDEEKAALHKSANGVKENIAKLSL